MSEFSLHIDTSNHPQLTLKQKLDIATQKGLANSDFVVKITKSRAGVFCSIPVFDKNGVLLRFDSQQIKDTDPRWSDILRKIGATEKVLGIISE